jgi:hypothetical protein
MNFWIFIGLLFFAYAAAAQSKKDEACPNKAKMQGVCYAIGDHTKDPNPQGKIRLSYQRKFLEASCVDIHSDDANAIQSKVSKMWMEARDDLVCNSVSFDIENGSILKFAVANKFDPFIYDITKWKIDLNKVDRSDNGTLLDYVSKHIERNKGNSIERRLNSYYRLLRAAGAKHESEL